MSGLILRDLSYAVVRANPQYRFVPFESLSQAEISGLGYHPAATTFAGILMQAGSGALTIKAVSAQAAALYELLSTPISPRAVLTKLPPHERDRILAGLVLDGILEIAIADAFVSQCAAYRLIVLNEEDIVGASRLSILSIRALKHGQRLGIHDPEKLAARLYFYHRVPVTLSWRKLWPDADAVLQYLGIAAGGPLRQDLFSCFEMSSPLTKVQWLSWHRRKRLPGEPSEANKHKLYVSAAAEHIKEAFAQVVALLPNSSASGLKIGPNANNLLRPDKLVVYFNHHDDLLTFADAVLPRLMGLSAHGVPFSAPIDDAGILSWAVDPPRSQEGIGWYADDSWRIWLCNRLALALLVAINSPETEIAPWRYALVRLWLSGIDTRTWTVRGKSGDLA